MLHYIFLKQWMSKSSSYQNTLTTNVTRKVKIAFSHMENRSVDVGFFEHDLVHDNYISHFMRSNGD